MKNTRKKPPEQRFIATLMIPTPAKTNCWASYRGS